jgi:hypothetical protein
MATERRDEIIEILDCDLGVRPKAAPGIDALLPHVRKATRLPGTLVVEFEPAIEPTLEAFVEAERLCCAGIGWEIDHGPTLALRITAADNQIAVIESLWKQAVIESHQ